MNNLVFPLSIIAFTSSTLYGQQVKKNLVFIFSDQQSYNMLGCYGNKDIKTPVIDQLANDGIRFNYCISSQPVSSPMRSMLLTGQHPLSNGVFTNDIKVITDKGITFGQALKNAGYSTGYIGKWHIYGGDRNRPFPIGPDRFGFDVLLSNNCTNDFRPGKSFYFNEKGEKVYFKEWEVYGQTNQAIDFLQNTNENEPFALFISYHAPHDQGSSRYNSLRYNTISELMNLYSPDSIALRPDVEDSPGNLGISFRDIIIN